MKPMNSEVIAQFSEVNDINIDEVSFYPPQFFIAEPRIIAQIDIKIYFLHSRSRQHKYNGNVVKLI